MRSHSELQNEATHLYIYIAIGHIEVLGSEVTYRDRIHRSYREVSLRGCTAMSLRKLHS